MLPHVKLGNCLRRFSTGEIMDDDAWLVRVFDGVVLMILLGFIERLQCDNLTYHGPSENFSLIQLTNIGLRNALFVLLT